MKTSDLRKFNGKVSASEREAGVVEKLMLLFLPKGFWVCLVDIEMLVKDTHQRDTDPKHIKGIREKFNPLYVSLPILTCRNDGRFKDELKLYMEDGSHTVDVLKLEEAVMVLDDGRRVIQALVHFDLDRAMAASVFAMLNSNRKKVAAWKSFEAGYIANHVGERTVMASANKHRLSTPITPPIEGKPDLIHAAEYLRIVRDNKYGARLIEQLFSIQKRTFQGQKHPLQFVRAIITVLTKHGVSVQQLRATLWYTDIVEYVMERALKCQQRAKAKRADAKYVVQAILETIAAEEKKAA